MVRTVQAGRQLERAANSVNKNQLGMLLEDLQKRYLIVVCQRLGIHASTNTNNASMIHMILAYPKLDIIRAMDFASRHG